jgi:ketosteroid isomerase-like protein
MLRGRQALQAFFQKYINQVGGTVSSQVLEWRVEGDLAYQMGTYTFADVKTPDQGKFVHIFRRQPDGSWKLHVAIFNSDKPV